MTQAAWQSSIEIDGGDPQVGLKFELCRMERVSTKVNEVCEAEKEGEARRVLVATRAVHQLSGRFGGDNQRLKA